MSKEVRDPLTEGNTLAVTKDGNYKVLESSADVVKADGERAKSAKEYKARAATTVKVANKDENELAEVVKTTKRKGR